MCSVKISARVVSLFVRNGISHSEHRSLPSRSIRCGVFLILGMGCLRPTPSDRTIGLDGGAVKRTGHGIFATRKADDKH